MDDRPVLTTSSACQSIESKSNLEEETAEVIEDISEGTEEITSPDETETPASPAKAAEEPSPVVWSRFKS